MQIRPLQIQDLEAVRVFTDSAIGKNYFSLEELRSIYQKSLSENIQCSFVLSDEKKQIQGVRLAYAPGQWTHGKSQFLRPDLWNVPQESVGYFQSLFIAPEARGENWGPQLSNATLESLRKLGAKAVVTHAWKESPNNSSLRYLKKFGFTEIMTHPLYWFEVDYECTRDGKPCRCTAIEMIKYL